MIGLPLNDGQCLGTITEMIAGLVAERDPVIVELAAKHPTTEALAEWIRTLPQRDDTGDQEDGPRVDACEPSQRLRIPADNPNCVERASLFIAVAELIDPKPVRQLATIDTELGMHTFPLENGAPIVLDPRLPRNCLDCGVALLQKAPMPVDARDAVEWTAELAEAGAAHVRNGPSRVRRARNAMFKLVDEGVAPADEETIDALAWLLAIAERAARDHGAHAVAIVRSVAQAIADLADEALARAHRNLSIDLGGLTLRPAPWISGIAKVAARVGANLGAAALQSKLQSLGISGHMLGAVEQELKREGLSLGMLAKPARLPTFASITSPRTR